MSDMGVRGPFIMLAAVVCWTILAVEGVIFFPTVQLGRTISSNNMSRISVNDFEVVNSNNNTSSALRCQSELTADVLDVFSNGCLDNDGESPVICGRGFDEFIPVNGTISGGWSGLRVWNESNLRVFYLTRRRKFPEEGYFNCYRQHDINPLIGLYILYPINTVTAAIEVVTGTLTFRVRCTSTGGRALDMAVSGPNGYTDISSNIQPVGTTEFEGSDSYTATTDFVSDGMAGDVYKCNATSVESVIGSITVEVAAAPTLNSLEQTAPTAVRVSWTASSEASVTGYRIHYSLSHGMASVTGIMNSTRRDITGLTNGRTYYFSVQVITSNMLPAVSEELPITLAPPDTPEGVVAAAESVSVRVSWQAVDDANRYIVTLSQVLETDRDGLLCHTDSHTVTQSVNAPSTTVSIAVGGGVKSTVTDMLRAYSTYEVTVKAVSDVRGSSQPSESRRVLTPQTSAREAPGNVTAEAVSSTAISVQWNGLSTCRLVNGLIVSYRVRLTVNGYTISKHQELRDGEDWRSRGEIILTGLTPFTTYSIAVAAVNENGDIGLYSDSVITMTPHYSCSVESESTASSSSTGLIVGVVIALVGVAVGISGLIGGAIIAIRHRPECKKKRDRTTEEKPTSGVSGPHRARSDTEGDYEYTQPSSHGVPECHEVYEGVY